MKKLFKIKINGAFGEYYFVINAEDAEHAKQLCYHYLPPTEKIIKQPIKTTKIFIKGILPVGTIQPYYRVFEK